MYRTHNNILEITKFKSNLRNAETLKNGDVQFESKIVFKWDNKSREISLDVLIKSGYESGNILLQDDDGLLDDLYVEFIPKFQEIRFTEEGFLRIKETSGESKIGSYEVLIIEV